MGGKARTPPPAKHPIEASLGSVDTPPDPAYADLMELRLEPDLPASLEEWSARSGRTAGELIEDALSAHLAELSALRATLDARYDEAASGAVLPIPAEEARRILNQRLDDRGRSIA